VPYNLICITYCLKSYFYIKLYKVFPFILKFSNHFILIIIDVLVFVVNVISSLVEFFFFFVAGVCYL
jgi:hypothetical protein